MFDVSILLTGRSCSRISLVFYGLTIVSMGGVTPSVLNELLRWYSFSYYSSLPLVSSDGTTFVLPSAKAEFFAQTFVSNSTSDDSVAIIPLSPPLQYIYPLIL